MATLAGHYPALRLGPPWWFHDSLNDMARHFDQVMETAKLYNTRGARVANFRKVATLCRERVR